MPASARTKKRPSKKGASKKVATKCNVVPGLRSLLVPIKTLNLDPRNARLHPKRNVESVVKSLSDLGQHAPLVVQKQGMIVRVGNCRLEAARSIVDNRSAELATWEPEVLAKLFAEMKAEEFDLTVTGFDVREIDRMIRSLETGVEEKPPLYNPGVVVSALGDLWVLGGRHRILCGDCQISENIERLVGDNQISLLSTDPPYAVDYDGTNRPSSELGEARGKDWSAVYNEVEIRDVRELISKMLEGSIRFASKDMAVYVWHAHMQLPEIVAAFREHDIHPHQVVMWVKPVATFGRMYYRQKCEPCLFGWRKGNKPKYGNATMENVWTIGWEGKVRPTDNEHPTQKPVELFTIPMEQHTGPDDVCFEPFSGSGSQIVAATKMGRRCFAMELRPAFVDVAIRRWRAIEENGEVIHEETGKTYDEITKERSEST